MSAALAEFGGGRYDWLRERPLAYVRRAGEEFVDADGAQVCVTGDSLRALMRDVASSDRLQGGEMEVFRAVTQFVSHLIGLIGFVIAWATVLLAGECHDRLWIGYTDVDSSGRGAGDGRAAYEGPQAPEAFH